MFTIIGFIIPPIVVITYLALISHVIFAIRLSLILIKKTDLENAYMCLLVTRLVPIFGSIAVAKKNVSVRTYSFGPSAHSPGMKNRKAMRVRISTET